MISAYHPILAAAERVTWRVEDLIGAGRALDFSRPFLPEGLARVEELDLLSPGERLVLNQIRAHTYLYMFGVVEEFIVPFLLDQTRPRLHDAETVRTRAYLEFVAEEVKHIDLFRRFRAEFLRGFGEDIAVIGPPEAIAQAVLGRHPLAVALLILGIEWMTQQHWLEGARDNGAIDPLFKDLLKHHWMEEAQHAKLDELMVETLAARCTPEEIDAAIDDYLALGGMFDGALAQQVDFDLAAFEAATGRKLEGDEREQVRAQQLQANRWTFLGSGMTHPRFIATVAKITPRGAERIAAVAPELC